MDRIGRKKTIYEIRVKGHLRPLWPETFNGMQTTLTPDGEMTLNGAVADQATLHALLAMKFEGRSRRGAKRQCAAPGFFRT